VPAIARALGVTEATVRTWLKRFNAGGVAGLADAPRSGRPPIYDAGEVGEVIAASLTAPDDRLTAYLQEHKGLGIGRTRIGEILRAEGLRWRTQETWFGERPDPDFVAKRGRSSPATRRHLRVAS
jgi:transposase